MLPVFLVGEDGRVHPFFLQSLIHHSWHVCYKKQKDQNKPTTHHHDGPQAREKTTLLILWSLLLILWSLVPRSWIVCFPAPHLIRQKIPNSTPISRIHLHLPPQNVAKEQKKFTLIDKLYHPPLKYKPYTQKPSFMIKYSIDYAKKHY